jgi:hypothetical protein
VLSFSKFSWQAKFASLILIFAQHAEKLDVDVDFFGGA